MVRGSNDPKCKNNPFIYIYIYNKEAVKDPNKYPLHYSIIRRLWNDLKL